MSVVSPPPGGRRNPRMGTVSSRCGGGRHRRIGRSARPIGLDAGGGEVAARLGNWRRGCRRLARTSCDDRGAGRDPQVTSSPADWEHDHLDHGHRAAPASDRPAGLRDLRHDHVRADGRRADDPRRDDLALPSARLTRVPVPQRRPRLRRHARAPLGGARLPDGREAAGARGAPRAARGPSATATAGLARVACAPAPGRDGVGSRSRPRRHDPPAACGVRRRPGEAAEPAHDAALVPRGPLAPRGVSRR